MAEVTAPALSPWALTSLERARQRLGRKQSEEEDFDAKMTDAINIATARMEQFTRRALRARAYTNPITLNATTAVAVKTFTVPSGLAAVRALSPALGVKLAEGSRLDTVTSDTAGTLDRAAASSGVASVTFGSAPLKVSGDGTLVSDAPGRHLQIPEFPLSAVYSIKWLGETGVASALDVTSLRIEAETGRIYLLSDVLPVGFMNLEVECQAGYRPPSSTDLGHREEWDDLEGLCLRLADVVFHDYSEVIGRATSRAIGGASSSFKDFALPADICSGLSRYVRRWG
jgi:hypothetical protein